MNRAESFSRSTVISLLNELLERPDVLINAIEDENTNWDAESLLNLAEICIVTPAEQ